MRIKKGSVSIFAVLLLATPSCFSQSVPSRQQQVEEHSRKAQEYLRENKPGLAVPEFKAIVALEPNNVDARGNLGVLLSFQGAYAEAIPQLRAALKLQPALWKIQALLGMAEKRTGDIKGALGDLEKAATTVSVLRELDPTNVELIYTAYRVYSDLVDESRLSLAVVAPKSARVHQMMAHELARQGKNDEAIANYREALELNPNTPGLHFELAEMLNASGSRGGQEEAKKEYE